MYFYSVHALVENDFISSRRPIWPARCTCVSMCICICMFVCVPHVRVHVCVCLCMRMCNSMCVCMRICVIGNEIALIFQCPLEVALICAWMCVWRGIRVTSVGYPWLELGYMCICSWMEYYINRYCISLQLDQLPLVHLFFYIATQFHSWDLALWFFPPPKQNFLLAGRTLPPHPDCRL